MPVRSGMLGLYYDNAGEPARNGVELALSWRPAARFGAELSYTWQDFVFRRFVLEGVDCAGEAGARCAAAAPVRGHRLRGAVRPPGER